MMAPRTMSVTAGERVSVRRRLALVLLCSAFFIDVMGSTSVFTASPSIGGALGLTPAELQWSFTAVTLPAGALLLPGGRLADMFGRRRMFMLGLALLLAASLACGLAPGAGLLIAARVAQGVAGALLMPAALALVIGTFTGERERSAALAAWSAIGGIGATAGLLFGGLVTAGLGWRWVFLVNVPAALLMLALCPVLLTDPPARVTSRRIDLPGTLTFSAGLALVIYAVSEVPALGWRDARTLGCGIAGVILLAAFAWVERTAGEPIVPPRLLRSRTLVAGITTLLAAGMCVDGLLFILTLYTQRARGYSPLEFGALAAVMTVSSVVAAWAAQRAVPRFGTRPVSAAGLGLLAVTCGLLAISTTDGGPLAVLIPAMLIFGLGMGAVFVAGSVASLQHVSDADSGVAAALQNISFSTGSTLGVAVLATIAAAVTARLAPAAGRAAPLAAQVGGYRAALVGGAAMALAGLTATLAIRVRPAPGPEVQDSPGSQEALAGPRAGLKRVG